MQLDDPTDKADYGDGLVITVAQFLSGTDVEKNLRRVEELTAQAAGRGAELVVFPEASMYAWDVTASELADAARSYGPAFLEGVRAAAVRHGVTLVVGMFEPHPDDLPYNRMVVVGTDGSIRGSYDKLHLYDAFSWQESDKISPGTTYPDGSELCVVQSEPVHPRPAQLLRPALPGDGSRAGREGCRCSRRQFGLGGRSVQGDALGDAVARPGDREDLKTRRRRRL